MLVKHIQGRVGLVRSALSFATMSGLHQSNDPQSSETHTSKHNPMASKDLRGLSNMGQLTEAEQSMSPIHSQKYRISTLYHFCSLLGYPPAHPATAQPDALAR